MAPSDEYNLGKASREIYSEALLGLSESFVPINRHSFLVVLYLHPSLVGYRVQLDTTALRVNASPKKISPVDATPKHAIYNESVLGQDKPMEMRLLSAATP